MMYQPKENAAAVKDKSRQLGFDACAIAAADKEYAPAHLADWLGRGYHADMAWMARTQALREDVRVRLPAARSVVMVAANYYQPGAAQDSGALQPEGKVARYAWGRDYHRALRKPLKRLAAFIDGLEAGAESYLGIDSAPILERTWAERAGLGWIGRNSLLLRRDIGSWFFLAAVVTTVRLAPDAPVEANCGTCRACIDACPTGAIVEEGVVDAGRCISYHTIENRGSIPDTISLEGWAFGCDICQDVCPWNRFATPSKNEDFSPREHSRRMALADIEALTQAQFDRRYEGSAIRRAGLKGLLRNLEHHPTADAGAAVK